MGNYIFALFLSVMLLAVGCSDGFELITPASITTSTPKIDPWFDSDGNFYIADTENFVVRKVSASTGNISTFAGINLRGYVGDGGQASAANLGAPSDLAIDSSNNLYIVDTENNAIRKVNLATGVISTVAGARVGHYGDGGQATAAQINTLSGTDVDASGNVYIADNADNVIRKIDASTGIISTIAGTGQSGTTGDGGAATEAQINGPTGIALDTLGNLYFAEVNSCVIRKIVLSTGIITTIAGMINSCAYSGDGMDATLAELNGPEGIAIDANDDLYIADRYNSVIRKFNHITGVITTIAGTGAAGYTGDGMAATIAKIDMPLGVDVDNDGSVYIADNGNNVVRKIDHLTGLISTIGGNGVSSCATFNGPATGMSFGGPRDISIDANGDVLVADCDFVRKIDQNTGNASLAAGDGTAGYTGDGGLATAAQLNYPTGVTVDSNGSIIIADMGNSAVRKVNLVSGFISTIGGSTSYDVGDGGLATGAKLNWPLGIAINSSGDIYIADYKNHRVRKFDAETGLISTVAGDGTSGYGGDNGLATAAQLSFPRSLAFDRSGNLYISDQRNYVIRKVDKTTGLITTVAGDGTSGYSGDGGPATSAQLRRPAGIAIDSDGNILIADRNAHVIRKVDQATGIISTIAGQGFSGYSGDGALATLAELSGPEGVSIDSDGNICISDSRNSSIRKIDPKTGIISAFVGSGSRGYTGDGGPAISAELDNPFYDPD